MSKRSLLYWALCTLLAFFAAHTMGSAAHADPSAGATAMQVGLVSVPDSVRSVLLFIGIFAVAFCFNRAWLNLKRKPGS